MVSNDFDSGDVKVIDNLHLKSYSCLVARELEKFVVSAEKFLPGSQWRMNLPRFFHCSVEIWNVGRTFEFEPIVKFLQ